MKKAAKFEDLLGAGIEELYDAEKQILAALPTLIAASSSEDLSGALAEELEEAKEQVGRLETLFEEMSEEPRSRECRPVQAMLAEGERLIGELEKSPVLDAALIATAR